MRERSKEHNTNDGFAKYNFIGRFDTLHMRFDFMVV